MSGGTSTVVVAVKSSPAAACAHLLSNGIGAPLLLLDDTAQYPFEEDRATCFVALSDAIDDGLLAGLLRRMTRSCRDRRPWGEEGGGDCLVAADDLAGLSRYVARLIATAGEEPGSDRFHLIASDSGRTEYRTLTLGGEPYCEVRELAPEAVGPVIAGADGVAAFYGHGGDACAYAGGVTVLCGRREHAEAGSGGALACLDRGAGCPRGPRPMPMAALRARHVMQTSCSSARFADSVLAPAFNLLLSFLDGGGLSYVGMALAGGSLECCSLYLAAMAEGRTLSETLALMNCFLVRTGLEQPVYVGIGLPELRARPRSPEAGDDGAIDRTGAGAAGGFSCDFGTSHFGTVLLSDPLLLDLAEADRLAFSLEGGEEAMWFCRLEESAGLRLRVFVFSFPAPLGRIRFLPFDREGLTESLHATLGSLRRWIACHRLIVGAGSEGATVGAAARDSFQGALPAVLNRLRFHGGAVRALESVMASLGRARDLLRDLLLAEIAPQLSGPFWLSNALRADQYFVSAEPDLCPACGGRSFLRRMGNHLSDERRGVHICMRCGIVEDFREGSAIARVAVSCPDTVECGGSLAVEVEARVTSRFRECLILAGLSGPYSPKLEPQAFQVEVVDGVARASFTFEIPATMPLHEFRWKCVVADADDVTFVARNIFVVRSA